MQKNYEFQFQTRKQKIILNVVKVSVLLLMANTAYTLGWHSDTTMQRLSNIGGLCIWFWIYSNLLHVKVEVKELFVPPFNIFNAIEFLAIGATLGTIDTLYTIWRIYELS